jgi:hypothetical protein
MAVVFTLRVPEVVMVPPSRPLPAVTLVTVPPLFVSAWHVTVPFWLTARMLFPAAQVPVTRVCTAEVLTDSVTSPCVPPPERPEPAKTAVMSPLGVGCIGGASRGARPPTTPTKAGLSRAIAINSVGVPSAARRVMECASIQEESCGEPADAGRHPFASRNNHR